MLFKRKESFLKACFEGDYTTIKRGIGRAIKDDDLFWEGLLITCQQEEQEAFDLLIEHSSNRHVGYVMLDNIFSSLIHWGSGENMARLLKHHKPNKKNRYLELASSMGRLEIAEQLVKYSDISQIERSFIYAVEARHSDVVKLFLKEPISKNTINIALVNTCDYQNIQMARILLKHSDPKHDRSNALKKACLRNNKEMIDLLFDVSEPDKVWEDINQGDYLKLEGEGMSYFKYRYKAMREKQEMGREMGASKAMKKARKF